MPKSSLFKWTLASLTLALAMWIGFWLGQKSSKPKGLNPVSIAKKVKATAPALSKKMQVLTTEKIESEKAAPPLDQNSSQDVGERDSDLTEEDSLKKEIVFSYAELKNAKIDDLRKNIQNADALIALNPDLYSAYKFKLISMLTLEIRFKEPIEVDEYEGLYDQMIEFQGIDEKDEILAEVQSSQSNLIASEIAGIDKDLLHIPFLRMSALRDYEGLGSIAEDYISEFPDSYLGPLYLAEAHWKLGEQEEAADVLMESLKQDDRDEMVLRIFSQFQKSPLERIQSLPLE